MTSEEVGVGVVAADLRTDDGVLGAQEASGGIQARTTDGAEDEHHLSAEGDEGVEEVAVRETILQEAERIVGGDRRQDYGDIRESFERIGKAWSAVLACEVTAEQVALCMIGLKLVRESHSHRRDNVVDVVGYALCLARMIGDE